MKPRRVFIRILPVVVAIIASGCSPVDGPEHRLDEQYYLGAPDISDQMALYRRLSDKSGIERVGQTVFAAGADRRHVIVQRHPLGDRSQTEYFILVRAKDSPVADLSVSVQGPFTQEQFERAREQLGVTPALSFSVVLESLR